MGAGKIAFVHVMARVGIANIWHEQAHLEDIGFDGDRAGDLLCKRLSRGLSIERRESSWSVAR